MRIAKLHLRAGGEDFYEYHECDEDMTHLAGFNWELLSIEFMEGHVDDDGRIQEGPDPEDT